MVKSLKSKGYSPVCYFSAGTLESWRTDTTGVATACIGKVLPDWPDEKYWDVRCPSVKDVLKARIKLCFDSGFVGIDADNLDVAIPPVGGTRDTGFTFTRQDAVTFVTWLADEAHSYGMGFGLKNAKELIPDVKDKCDWAVNEECFSDEKPCDNYKMLKDAGKAVYQVEYLLPVQKLCSWCIWSLTEWRKQVCPQASTYGLTPILKNVDLKQKPYYTCV